MCVCLLIRFVSSQAYAHKPHNLLETNHTYIVVDKGVYLLCTPGIFPYFTTITRQE